MKTCNLAAGATYLFANNPVNFIPNIPNLGVVSVAYTATGNVGGQNQILCQDHLSIDFAGMAGLWGGDPGSKVAEASFAQMVVVPNPAETTAEVRYAVENLPKYGGGTIKLYGLDGRLIESHQVHEARGTGLSAPPEAAVRRHCLKKLLPTTNAVRNHLGAIRALRPPNYLSMGHQMWLPCRPQSCRAVEMH